MSKPSIDIKDFARRVERLCDFFLEHQEQDGSDDLKVLHELKQEAADIQFHDGSGSEVIEGLYDYMKGANV